MTLDNDPGQPISTMNIFRAALRFPLLQLLVLGLAGLFVQACTITLPDDLITIGTEDDDDDDDDMDDWEDDFEEDCYELEEEYMFCIDEFGDDDPLCDEILEELDDCYGEGDFDDWEDGDDEDGDEDEDQDEDEDDE